MYSSLSLVDKKHVCELRKRISEETNSKLRVRGKGSGYLEIEGRREALPKLHESDKNLKSCEKKNLKQKAPVPLMVAVTTDKMDVENFKKVQLLLSECSETQKDHADNKREKAITMTLDLLITTSAFSSFGPMSKRAETILQDFKCRLFFWRAVSRSVQLRRKLQDLILQHTPHYNEDLQTSEMHRTHHIATRTSTSTRTAFI